MNTQTLQELWATQDRKLDATLRLNRRLLQEATLQRVRTPLRRLSVLLCAGIAAGLAVVMGTGSFLYDHLDEPRFLLPALAIFLWSVAYTASAAYQLAALLHLDYGGPVTRLQQQVENLCLLRLRILRWALLTGQLVWWMPLLIVGAEAFFGVDVYPLVGGAYVAANLLFGLAVIPVAIWLSHRYAHRLQGARALRWLADHLAGHNLRAARRELDELSAFQRESPVP